MKLDRSRLTIAVESELCAGGEEVAAALAGLLKVRCLSAEITELASRLSGISKKLLRRYETRRVREAYDVAAEGEDTMRIPAEKYFLASQVAACRALADEGPCVLVDHHSNAALSDRENHIGIFVHADRVDRLQRFARERGKLPAQAQRSFRQTERERANCFRALARDWGKASNYCLTVNSSRAEPETLARNIVQYLETISQEELVRPVLAPKAQRLVSQARIISLEEYRALRGGSAPEAKSN